jgi:hypothetical protein
MKLWPAISEDRSRNFPDDEGDCECDDVSGGDLPVTGTTVSRTFG